MAFSILKLTAVTLLAISGIQAAPTAESADIEIEARAAAPSFVNGDFSKPLQGSWSYTTYMSQPANPFHKVGSVLQIEGQTKCSDSDENTHRVDFKGTVINLVKGENYVLSYDYKFAEDTTYSYWYLMGVTGTRENNAQYTKKAKAGVWYTFQIDLQANKSGTQTASFTYINCPVSGISQPDVQREF